MTLSPGLRVPETWPARTNRGSPLMVSATGVAEDQGVGDGLLRPQHRQGEGRGLCRLPNRAVKSTLGPETAFQPALPSSVSYWAARSSRRSGPRTPSSSRPRASFGKGPQTSHWVIVASLPGAGTPGMSRTPTPLSSQPPPAAVQRNAGRKAGLTPGASLTSTPWPLTGLSGANGHSRRAGTGWAGSDSKAAETFSSGV